MEVKEREMQVYEITMLTTAEDFPRAKEIIGKSGGTIEEEKPQGKVRLAYPVKKQAYAFLNHLKVKLDGSAVAVLSNELKLDQNVLRFLVSTPRTNANFPATPRSPRPAVRRSIFAPRAAKPPVAEALTNEALEKKIEEINERK